MAADPAGDRGVPVDERHAVQPAALLGHVRPRRCRVRPWSTSCCGRWRRRACWSWAGRCSARPGTRRLERRLTSATLISLGAGTAYAYSTLAVLDRRTESLLRHRHDAPAALHLGRYLDAAGRARAMRDLAPMLAVGAGAGDRPRRRHRDAPSGARGDRRHTGARPAGRAPRRRRHRRRRLLPRRRGGDHGREPACRQDAGCAVLAGSINHEGALVIRSTGAGTATPLGADRALRAGAWPAEPRPAPGGSDRGRVRSCRARARRPYRAGLGAWSRSTRRCSRPRRPGRGMPLRAGSRRRAGDLARHRAAGAARAVWSAAVRSWRRWPACAWSPSTRPERSPRVQPA